MSLKKKWQPCRMHVLPLRRSSAFVGSLLLLSSSLVQATNLEGFNSPALREVVSTASKQAQTKTLAPSKFALNIQKLKNKNLEIKDAVIWHAPNKIFLSKKLSEEEIQNLDTQALEILVSAMSANNPNFVASSKKLSNKNFILKLGDLAKASDNEHIANLGSSLVRNKQEAETYVRKTLAQIYQEYAIFKEIYRAQLTCDVHLNERCLNARKNLIYLCGAQAIEEVENLWRRER